MSWLVLVYKLPREPSRLRVRLSRFLAGERGFSRPAPGVLVACSQGGDRAEKTLGTIRSWVDRVGGSSLLLRTDSVSAGGAWLRELQALARRSA